jgi:D-beta-D-heptose 7-phosphate kinase/D-beta-D-heptose 1-phosphate adenosyltransferase
MSRAPLVVVGDALLDRDIEGVVERLAPDAPVPVVDEQQVRTRPGGAGLAALLAATDGREVRLVCALGRDPAGEELRAALEAAGVDVVDIGLDGPTPEKVRIRAAGRALLRVDRGGAGAPVRPATAAARAAIGWASAVLVADYGRGVAAEPGIRDALASLAPDVPLVWDPHPRGPVPVGGCALVTPNVAETARFVPDVRGDGVGALSARAEVLAERWDARQVCVTRGVEGALLVGQDGALAFGAEPAVGGDACGAGDRFASRAAELLADGADVAEAVAGAVAAATTFVARGGAASVGRAANPRHDPAAVAVGAEDGDCAPDLPPDVAAVVARARAAGGAVVATGGCFDLLHTGHVRTLEAARSLGDCLVVLLNADTSVRRLKGPERPVVGQEDRAAVLRALRCVDAVLVFDEDDPSRALARVRPDLWAKGGDYRVEDLPEADVLAEWGARIVLLPYLDGRSTTRLIQEVAVRVAG